MLFPRSVGPLAIAALALSAWLHARGISALVGERLAAPVSRPLMTPPPAPPAATARSADVILARNPFDSTTGPVGLVAPAAPLAGVPECAGVQVLALAASDPPAVSLALLRFEGEHEPQLRAVGGDVVSIEPAFVVLERGGTTCTARIFSLSAAASAAPARQAPASRPPPGIASTGPTSFELDRAARDALLDGAADWMKTVSVRPEKVGDDVVGLRVVGVAAGSPVGGLGVVAGDVLQAVNQVPLTSPERMLEALGRVRTADHLSVVLVRGGHPVQVDYDIR